MSFRPSTHRLGQQTQGVAPPTAIQKLPLGMTPKGKITDQDYSFIRKLIYKETRINLGDGKRELVSARLGKRLRANNVENYTEYCQMLQSQPNSGELYHLIDAISTNHTFFFREINHFNYLNSHILPSFVNGDIGASKELKIWSCACSTGEEPYSLSIALEEFLRNSPSYDWSIECSDISNRVLDFAAKGIYDQDRLKGVKQEWLKRYFQKGEKQMDGYFRVRPEISRKLQFQRLNLFQASFPWKQKFQVIFCRNVMIYFDRETQQELVGRLSQFLVPGGYLMIGHAESLAGIRHPYNSIKPAIYQLPG